MDYIFLFLCSIIILTCFYLVAAPFFSKEEVSSDNSIREEVSLESVYRAVNELEMDFLMKKMEEKDYLQLKEQYQLLTANLMKKGHQHTKKKSGLDDSDQAELEIMKELQILRKFGGR